MESVILSFKFSLDLFYFMFSRILPPCVYLCTTCMPGAEEDARFPTTRVTDDCEPSSGRWKANLSLLQEHPVLQTAELSLQPCARP